MQVNSHSSPDIPFRRPVYTTASEGERNVFNNFFGIRSRGLLMLSAATWGAAGSAYSAEPRPAVLEEIVVTAQRRSENLQDVPIAVTAFGSEFLESAKIDELSELGPLTPNFQYNEFNVGQVDLFIRGVGSDLDSAGADSSVGAFVDDVYIARGTGITGAIYDLERVEVIRGPAGALYGKNTIGGAINFVTKRPSFEAGSSVRLDIGNYNLIGVTAHATGPLTEKVAARVAVSGQGRDGYALNTFTGTKIEDDNSKNARGQLLYEGDAVTSLLSADFSRRRGTGNWRWQRPLTARNAPFANPNPREARHLEDGRQSSNTGGVSLRLDWDAPAVKVTSITAWRRNAYDIDEDVTGTYVDLLNPPRPDLVPSNPDVAFFNDISEKARQFSQELRFASSALDNRLDWVAGAYYLRENIDRDDATRFIFPDLGNFVGGELAEQEEKTDSVSAFAETTYHFSDAWQVAAGLRWSRDKKDFTVTKSGVPTTRRFLTPDGLGFTAGDEQSWSAVTPRISVSYQPVPNQTYYATVSRGYKSGGFDGIRDTSPQAASRPVGPEYAWNYEAGAKSQWLDDRLRLNVAAFYIDYTDLQTQQLLLVDPSIPPQRVLVNAGKVVAKGAEVETVAALFGPFRAEVNYGYLNSKFASTLIINNQDLDGLTTRRSPKHKVGASLLFDHETQAGFLSARATYQYTSAYFFDNNNSPVTAVESNSLISANVDFTPADSNWSVSFWGKNLTDELYVRHTTAVFNSGYVLLGPPRTYGVSIMWRG